MVTDSRNKRPDRLLALTMRFALLESLVVANPIVPAPKWHAFSHEHLDVFLHSSSFVDAITKPIHGDRCERERWGDKNLTETRQTKSSISHGLSLRTSVAMIQATPSTKLDGNNVDEYQHVTMEERNVQADSSWPKSCVDDVRRCYLPIQHDPVALCKLNKNETTVSNVTTHVKLEVDRLLQRKNDVDPCRSSK
jgi:hypothetical protein